MIPGTKERVPEKQTIFLVAPTMLAIPGIGLRISLAALTPQGLFWQGRAATMGIAEGILFGSGMLRIS